MPGPLPTAAGPTTGAALIIDRTDGPATAAATPLNPERTIVPSEAVAGRSGPLRNRASTVAQGALIPAVLETAIDSTRPGPVRALTSRDTLSFDGSRVLIPRGSRLIGEYRSEANPGQRRVFVAWTRLIRPDGVSVALLAPGADALGRAGLAGRVDNHFWPRFGGAILQSALELGVNLASRDRSSSAAIFVGAGQTAVSAPSGASGPISPTITVRQGAEVTVFVAQDLDFSNAASGR